ncbi:hypothetical protein EDD29_6976 [Actinocorallia herbida]|uniref:Uncharacterized protein n=1 Tax=Actinocorallia herbida TaxID=58109 RepID=A0A3N1D6X7_9ACTN|nr:hypothetical protein [Actinocorallia herbida]ROO89287.1 hypothetical protein EDD29_6976 [Actinocorallia herbida]
MCGEPADEEGDSVKPGPDVFRFREQLLGLWPDLADRISPWAADPGWRQPSGREDLAAYYVGLTLSWSIAEDTLQAMIDLAEAHPRSPTTPRA